MLKFFRNQKDSWLVKGILVLTALSFMSLFGIQGTAGLRQSNKTVYTVNGVKTSAQAFLADFDAKINAQRALTNAPFSLQDALNAGLLSYFLKEKIAEDVAKQAVETAHIYVGDDVVRATIMNKPAFKNADGSFNRRLYAEFLRKTGKTERSYVEQVRSDLRAERLFATAGAVVAVPEELAILSYTAQKERRDVDIVRLIEKELPVTQRPAEKELRDLYDNAGDQFVAPEYRKLSVMTLTLNDAAKNLPVSDEELETLYNERSDRYVTEETRTVNQMMFETKEDAQKAFEAVQNGEDFFAVAEKQANQTREETALGAVVKAGLLTELADPVFSAKKNELIAPVQTAFGWQVLQVTQITPRKVVPFEKAKAELTKEIKNLRAYDRLMNVSVAIEDMLGEGRTLEDVAAANGLTVKTVPFVDMTGLRENGEKADVSQDVLSVAFVNEEGQASAMTETKDGFFSVRVDEIRDPQQKSFEAAKKELTELWKTEKQHEKAVKLYEKIANTLETRTNLKEIARENGLKTQTLTDVSRRDARLPETSAADVFKAKKGGIVKTPVPEGYVFIKVTNVKSADPKKDEKGVLAIKQNMKHLLGVENADVLLEDYGRWFKTTVNEETVAEIGNLLNKSAGSQNDDDY